MADSPAPTNTVRSDGTARSLQIGDVPDALRRRFLTESGRLRGGLAYYVDATTLVPSFRDRGRELLATRSDPSTIRDLIEIAHHRGWSHVRIQGAPGFRREAWLAGRAAGLEVDGYAPSERDAQALLRRLEARVRPEDREATAAAPARRRSRPDDVLRPSQRLRIAEAVVRDRISDPSAQARILAAARTRLAQVLERSEGPARTPPRRAETVERQR